MWPFKRKPTPPPPVIRYDSPEELGPRIVQVGPHRYRLTRLLRATSATYTYEAKLVP